MFKRRASLLLALGALVSCPASAHAGSPLLGQWSLDSSHEDQASQVTADSSGNGLDLRAPNGSMHLGTPARFGTGSTLPANLTPLRVDSPVLAPAQLTLLAWVKQSGNPGTLRYVAGRGDDALTCGGSSFALYTGYPAKPGLRFYVRYGASGSALTDAPADAAVFDGQWHLVAGTYDGAAARLFVDGALVGSPMAAPPPLTYALGGGSSFYVDGYPVEGCALGQNADDWPGAIDEVRLYDRALTSDELLRLAAAAGPAAPGLELGAPAAPPAPPAPLVPAPVASGPPPLPSAVQLKALGQAVGAVSGASKDRPGQPLQSALSAAQSQGLGVMKSAAGTSRVDPPRPAQQLSAKQVRQTRPDPKVQDRLEAMKYGIAAQLPATAPGQVVEAVATVALERKLGGRVRTQTIVLPPAVDVVDAGAKQADLQFPVDRQATTAITKNDVAKAALSIQAVTLDSVSDLSQLDQLRLQAAMDRRSKTAAALGNLLKKLSDTEAAITQNLRGGLTSSERDQQRALDAKASKLGKQAAAIEQQRDAANKAAAEAMKAAVTGLVTGLTSGVVQTGALTPKSLPTASTALLGCSLCGIAAVTSK